MTLSDFQGHLSIANLPKCDFPYSSAAVDKISTNTEHRAVPLRHLSLLYGLLLLYVCLVYTYSITGVDRGQGSALVPNRTRNFFENTVQELSSS